MTETPVIRIRRIRPQADADIPLPGYMSSHAAGMDIRAAVPEAAAIAPGKRFMVPTGFAIALPGGFEAQIRPRSGLAAKYSVGMINSPGTIDADYRGEIMVPLLNFGDAPFVIQRGDRIAQMVIKKVWRAKLDLVEVLDETERGDGGFGHTGIA